jgi:hypothetical protein
VYKPEITISRANNRLIYRWFTGYLKLLIIL